MAKPPDEDKLPLIVAGVVGAAVAVAIGAAITNSDRRATFAKQLRSHLEGTGVTLAACELGRDATSAVWILTVRLQESVGTFHLPVSDSPFAESTAKNVADRLLQYLRSHNLLVAA